MVMERVRLARIIQDRLHACGEVGYSLNRMWTQELQRGRWLAKGQRSINEMYEVTRIAHRGTRPFIDIHPNVFVVPEDGRCETAETRPRHSSTAPTVGRRFGRDDQHCFRIFHKSFVNHCSFGLSGLLPLVTFCMTSISLWPAKGD